MIGVQSQITKSRIYEKYTHVLLFLKMQIDLGLLVRFIFADDWSHPFDLRIDMKIATSFWAINSVGEHDLAVLSVRIKIGTLPIRKGQVWAKCKWRVMCT